MYPFKDEDVIYGYTPSHVNDYQPHINFLILKRNSPCKPLVKISTFSVYNSNSKSQIIFPRDDWTNDIR